VASGLALNQHEEQVLKQRVNQDIYFVLGKLGETNDLGHAKIALVK
jgi:hypothetical protein